jgi:hypothetical protein
MTKTRRRFKQTIPLRERLSTWAEDMRERAATLPEGPEREALLKRAGQADVAAHIDQWAQSPGLQPPT